MATPRKCILPTTLDKDMHIYSDYAELAELALNSKKISEGKYNEYLLEGGYEDILFGNKADDQ